MGWCRAAALFLAGWLTLPCQAQTFQVQASQESTAPARIAIILDDVGYNRHSGEQVLQLPVAVSLAFIPFTPYARDLATQAHAKGHDILLHLPMASADPERRLDDGGIMPNQSETDIRQRVQAAIAAVPFAVGLNNHMGSQITTDPIIMGWVMDEVRKTPLFFIDSMTSADSVARTTALDYRIPALRRDVFLDNDTNTAAIDRAFKQLLKKARQQGYAVAIGHPHKTTLDYLEKTLPTLASMNIELVAVSELTVHYGRPVDAPIRLQDLSRWILALPTPTATHLDFTN